jgi:hypothetical protein
MIDITDVINKHIPGFRFETKPCPKKTIPRRVNEDAAAVTRGLLKYGKGLSGLFQYESNNPP